MTGAPLLLATKLNPPPVRQAMVARTRLTTLLDERRPLTLISAPPGFGKTTLLSEWLARQDRASIAWLALDADDNDPLRFLAHLAAALDRAFPGAGKAALALVAAPELADPRIVVTTLVNALNDASHDVVLVLDDYHVLQAKAIHDVLTFLLDHRPPRLSLCITTRADPPLPLSRLRARGELLEIRAADLRFNQGEIAQFLESVMGVRLTSELLTALSTRTEGWIAGLQLAALSMRGREDVSSFVHAFAGSNAYIVDYLADEVLRQQPAHIERFLLQTSILDQLNGSVCDAVTAGAGSGAVLEGLERSNLFVVPLDDERQWYRYHHLFRDVLRQRLKGSGQDVPALLRRASDWHEHHGNAAESIEFALAAGDVDRVASLIAAHWASIDQSGRIKQALTWFAALPEPLVRNHPNLCVLHAGLLAHGSQPEAAEARLQDAERHLTLPADRPIAQTNALLGHISAIRAEIARSKSDFAGSVVLAREAMALLPESETAMHQRLAMYVLLDFLLTGNVTSDAINRQARLAEMARASDNLMSHASGTSTLGWMLLYRGELHKAAATFEQVMANWKALGVENLGISMFCRLGLADIWREWGKWAEAETYLMRGLETIQEPSTPDANLVWVIALSLTRLKRAQGDWARAREVLDRLIDLAQTQRLGALLSSRLAAVKAWLSVAQGDWVAARSWADTHNLQLDDDNIARFQREVEYLILTRVWLALGRSEADHASVRMALALIDRMLPNAESGFRTRSAIEMLVLRALALQVLGDSNNALEALERALRLAEPEGFQRVFLDEGEPMHELLRRLDIAEHLKDSRLRAYRDRLVSAFPHSEAQPSIPYLPDKASPHSSPASLIEPLSERELEVLRFVAEGMSDRQIAERMIVAVGTVKRHLNNLYGKLGVHSRTAALAKAKAFGLL